MCNVALVFSETKCNNISFLTTLYECKFVLFYTLLWNSFNQLNKTNFYYRFTKWFNSSFFCSMSSTIRSANYVWICIMSNKQMIFSSSFYKIHNLISKKNCYRLRKKRNSKFTFLKMWKETRQLALYVLLNISLWAALFKLILIYVTITHIEFSP